MLDPVRGGRFIVFHDAYQYFEIGLRFPRLGCDFGQQRLGPESGAHRGNPGDRIAREGIDCVMAEPQFNPGLVATVLDGTTADTAVLDPLGSDLEPGPALYPQLIRNLASSLAGCL